MADGDVQPALVTDVHIRSALAGMRALGRAGVPVVTLAPSWLSAGQLSRYATLRAAGPDAARDPEGFVARLAAAAIEHGPLVVYPGREAAIDALLAAPRVLLDRLVLPYPGRAALERLRDKRRLADLAAESGLRVPELVATGTAAELRRLQPSVPVMLKPARPGGALASALPVLGPGALRATLDRLPADEPLLVQERATGPLTAVALVVGPGGEVVARFQQEARRTWPPGAGPSSLAIGVAPDPELVRRCADLLRRAGYWGLAQLQFVGTARGPALIDVNPRFYGSLPLALASGVNLPHAWHAVATGRELPAPGPYRTGVVYRWLEADLSALARGHPELLLSRLPAPRTGSVWARDDPVASAAVSCAAAAVRVARRLPLRRAAT